MARAKSTLPFPPEIFLEIFKYFENYDWPNNPKAEHIAMPIHVNNYDESSTWLRVLSSSKQDISNIRLMCKQFDWASLASFGFMLGDRIFRRTKVGLEDLKGITKKEGLARHIKTLTFGSAKVNDKYYKPFHLLATHSTRDKELQQNMLSISQALAKYKPLPLEEAREGLKAVLRRLPNLKELQMVVDDSPSYLGGWLEPEERAYIDANQKRISPRAFYIPSGLDVAYSVLQLLSEMKGQVQGLKFSRLDSYVLLTPGLPCHLLPETLRTLRMNIDWSDSDEFEGGKATNDESANLFSALKNLSNL